jgi:hypothetical protein
VDISVTYVISSTSIYCLELWYQGSFKFTNIYEGYEMQDLMILSERVWGKCFTHRLMASFYLFIDLNDICT